MNYPKEGIQAMFAKRFASIALRLAVAVGTTGMMVSSIESRAGVITNGTFSMGVDSVNGNIYDVPTGIGFRRLSDGYDPIAPGSPREAWGISAGTVAGFADPQDFGVVNISAGTLVINGGGTGATISNSLLDPTGASLLTLTQTYNFVPGNANVVEITESITNVSGVSQLVNFARNVDWDVAPTEFNENTLVTKLGGPATAASFYGFENPSPLVPFGSPATVGVVNGPADLGTGVQLNLGTLAAGATTSFDIYYGLNMIGQSPAGLTAQINTLSGSWFTSTGYSSDGDFNTATNSIVMAIGPAISSVPEPSSVALLAIGAVSCVGMTWHRRRRQS